MSLKWISASQSHWINSIWEAAFAEFCWCYFQSQLAAHLCGSWLMELLNSSWDEVIWSPADKILRDFITVIEFVWITYRCRIVSLLFIYPVVTPYINLKSDRNSTVLLWKEFKAHSAKARHLEIVLLYHFNKPTFNVTLNGLFGFLQSWKWLWDLDVICISHNLPLCCLTLTLHCISS